MSDATMDHADLSAQWLQHVQRTRDTERLAGRTNEVPHLALNSVRNFAEAKRRHNAFVDLDFGVVAELLAALELAIAQKAG